jgi:hypothetical protein
MLKRIGLLPKELVMKKYKDITGKSSDQIKKIEEVEGFETIADMVEEHLINQHLQEKLQHN